MLELSTLVFSLGERSRSWADLRLTADHLLCAKHRAEHILFHQLQVNVQFSKLLSGPHSY